MERLLKTNERLNKQTVWVDLRTLSDSLIDQVEAAEQREVRIEELETVLWEGRFTDYIARGLAKVKSSQAWQQPQISQREQLGHNGPEAGNWRAEYGCRKVPESSVQRPW